MDNESIPFDWPLVLRDYNAPKTAEFSKSDLDWIEAIECDVFLVQSPDVLAITTPCGGKIDYHIQIDPTVYPQRVGDGPLIEVPIRYGFYFSRNSGKTWKVAEEAERYHGPEGVGIAHNMTFLSVTPQMVFEKGVRLA